MLKNFKVLKLRHAKQMYILFLVSIFILTAMFFTACDEIPIPEVKKDVYIYDDDNIIEGKTEEMLNSMLVELEQKTSIEFVVISTKSLLSMDIEDYSNRVFNKLGIGKKDIDNGILLLISKKDEKVRLEIGRGLEGTLNDAKCGKILDNYFVPYREKNQYNNAINFTVQATVKELASKYKVEITGLDSQLLSKSVQKEKGLPLWVWIIIIIILILILTKFSKGGGSGTFLGSSDGDSFGGGFSGGGGASR